MGGRRNNLHTIVLTVCVLLAISPAFAQSADSDDALPAGEEAEQAALDFIMWCGPCHGRTGQGDGPIAAQLQTPPPDLTRIKERSGGEFPAEKIRARIDGREQPQAHGTQEMPAWGYWFNLQATGGGLLEDTPQAAEQEVSERIDLLVQYLQALQK